VSSLAADAADALAFDTPPGFPVTVLSVLYGEAEGTPDPTETVYATWTPHDYPGTFTSLDEKHVNFADHLAFVIAYDYWIVQQLYALDGGPWPPAPEYPPQPPSGGPIRPA
jgi:hypothetical protein